MGTMIARGWIDHGDVADSLWNACIRNGLIADDGADAAQPTLASGVAAGMRSPHSDLAERPGSYSKARGDRQSGTEPVRLEPITLGNLLSLDIKPREFIIEPLIHERGLVMVFAWRGVGKTWFALCLGYAIASGGQYLKWAAKKPRRVVHVCGEMPAVDLKQRLEQVVTATKDGAEEQGWFRIISADLHEFGIPDLATPEGQVAMDAVLGDAEVIIFDNVSTLFRTGQENESQSWVAVQNWLLKLRREGRSVVIIHHTGKGKEQRGTSKREDVLDVVLNLREPSDYEPSEGARFEVHFEKARGLSGTDAVSPFEAKLEIRDGQVNWTMREIEDARLSEILELKKDGMSVRKIAAELGLSKSAVQRALNRSAKGDA
jgi:putative DNA primase/helicase